MTETDFTPEHMEAKRDACVANASDARKAGLYDMTLYWESQVRRWEITMRRAAHRRRQLARWPV